MSNDMIRYDIVVQRALRNAVREILVDAARNGLPGDHHFYISYKTTAPGVVISERMRKKYPEEITIVLQHQFWDLIVTDKQFEVGLSFGNVPERLVVPFDAITGFIDPSVQFALKFEPDEPAAGAASQEPATQGSTPAGAPVSLAQSSTADASAETSEQGATRLPASHGRKTGKQAPAAADEAGAGDSAKKKSGTEKAEAEETGDDAESGNVVSIDAFRKK